MNKLTESIGGLKQFLREVGVELGKCSWPSRQELLGSAVIVIIAVVILGAYVGLCDAVSLGFLKLIIH